MNQPALAAAQDASVLLSMQKFLGAARQRIWAAAALQLLQRMALVCLALALAMLIIHFLLHALPAGIVVTLLAMPLVAALLLATRLRPSLAQSAGWVDRQLNAQSTFGTFLEFVIERRAAASPRVLQAFAQRCTPVLQHSSATLRNLAAPSMLPVTTLWGVCVALLVALLWLPGRSPPSSPGTTNAVGESAVGSPTLDSGSEQSSRAVRAALLQERQNAAPGPDTAKLAGGPKAEAAPTQNLGEASATNTAQRNGDAALANGEGSGAGHNAAVVRETDAAALNAALRSRFRDITLGAQHNTRQEASGSGVALAALSLTAQTAEFDQVQAALAARAAAAQVNQPAARGSSGPGGALLQRRYLQLRNTTP